MPYNLQPYLTKAMTVDSDQDFSGRDLYELSAPESRFMPPGSIIAFAAAVPPSGFLACNGQTVNREDYPDLWPVIGDLYGTLTATTFVLPDLRTRVIRHTGPGYNMAATGGKDSITLSASNLPAHTHPVTITDPGHTHLQWTAGQVNQGISGGGAAGSQFNVNTQAVSTGFTGITASAGANTTTTDPLDVRDLYISLNYVIKY